LSEQTATAQAAPKYPVSEHFKVLDGYDIYRSNNLIVALVAVEANNRKDLRLYRWQNRQGNWKVDLCRMIVTRWHWSDLAEKACTAAELRSAKIIGFLVTSLIHSSSLDWKDWRVV
jgi:hypothetical protein